MIIIFCKQINKTSRNGMMSCGFSPVWSTVCKASSEMGGQKNAVERRVRCLTLLGVLEFELNPWKSESRSMVKWGNTLFLCKALQFVSKLPQLWAISVEKRMVRLPVNIRVWIGDSGGDCDSFYLQQLV